MQFIDLVTQQQQIRAKIEENIKKVLDHGQYIMGPEIKALESSLCDYTGAEFCISCSSGTDALLMALMAYDIGPGDAVLTTPFTFIATAEAISLAGATPVFVDIDPDTYNIDPDQLEKTVLALQNNEKLIPKGIIAVDLFGLCADYDKICRIAEKYGLFVIEDAAQSFGADYHGKKACNLADIACTSFFPAKPLGGYGDGGAVFTSDEKLADKLVSVRVHGMGTDKYENVRIGINGRLDSLQAAILLAKMDIFPDEIKMRQKIADRYLEKLGSQTSLVMPDIPKGFASAWAQYSILAEDETHRESIQKKLSAEKIPTAIYYPIPLHLQTAFKFLNYKNGDFPVSEDCAKRIFSIPMHPYLKSADQDRIIAAVLK
ncbi:DegT/DnrJ/EryC1/StrS family aminotransferase [Desulfobacterales bacterium HSG16]|nr:DegT/DnrJ/EryC1/StrS family aminotransferase [Desulfobacterales bacterium HSG16]